jgi:hypothetical protein
MNALLPHNRYLEYDHTTPLRKPSAFTVCVSLHTEMRAFLSTMNDTAITHLTTSKPTLPDTSLEQRHMLHQKEVQDQYTHSLGLTRAMLTALQPLQHDYPKEKRGLWIKDQIKRYEKVVKEMVRQQVKFVAALKTVAVHEDSMV